MGGLLERDIYYEQYGKSVDIYVTPNTSYLLSEIEMGIKTVGLKYYLKLQKYT